ncbi:hypothetical protein TNCV_3941261 [Trichonephila clavipes]|uniref:Uncharacterized protein n=1 Tax=Trichonephila clavipes TaxID=2585209 RepID=A0A8X7B8T8_TRICX|nr:hypothetical protein TNCV_3941261 [Trichonephila clavipes]
MRFRAIGRLEASQSQVEMARWVQVARKWYPGYYRINSKQAFTVPRKVDTKHRHLHRIGTTMVHNDRSGQRILCLLITLLLCLDEECLGKQPFCRDWPLRPIFKKS